MIRRPPISTFFPYTPLSRSTFGVDKRHSTRLRFSIPSVSQKRRIYRPPDPIRRDDVWLGDCIIEDRLDYRTSEIQSLTHFDSQLDLADIGCCLSANNLLRFL